MCIVSELNGWRKSVVSMSPKLSKIYHLTQKAKADINPVNKKKKGEVRIVFHISYNDMQKT